MNQSPSGPITEAPAILTCASFHAAHPRARKHSAAGDRSRLANGAVVEQRSDTPRWSGRQRGFRMSPTTQSLRCFHARFRPVPRAKAHRHLSGMWPTLGFSQESSGVRGLRPALRIRNMGRHLPRVVAIDLSLVTRWISTPNLKFMQSNVPFCRPFRETTYFASHFATGQYLWRIVEFWRAGNWRLKIQFYVSSSCVKG